MPRISSRRLAGLSLLFNLLCVLLRLQRFSYDAYPHIFLADHYRQSWWSLWEPRWYLGFSMVSYPPLVHQLIALLSWPFAGLFRAFSANTETYPGAFVWAGEETAYVALLLGALVLLPLGVRSMARLFTGPRTAEAAALLAIFLPGLSMTAWVFGQLPTILATGVILLALARGAAYARSGRGLLLLQAVLLAATAAAMHHGVFLLVPFAGAAIGWRMLAEAPLSGWRARAVRLAVWAGLSGAAVAAVLWPFLLWSRGEAIQAAIDHGSRHNFLADGMAALFFFWSMYGPLLLALPWALATAYRRPRRWLPLLAVVVVLVGLGLGGTTPLPRLLFGAGWAWLTYDRFSFWAGLCLLPFAAAAALRLWRRPTGRNAAIGLFAVLLVWAIGPMAVAALGRTQPPPLDLAPLALYLDAPENRPYRYFTLGFGDSLAKLSAITRNGTPDGDYHTARPLPELRASGLGSLDGAVWNPQGVEAVLPFLRAAPRYGVRWAFVGHREYVPVLRAAGWKYAGRIGEVPVWEFLGVKPVPANPPPPEPPLAAAWWGSAPLAAAVLAGAALTLGQRRRFQRAAWLTGLARLRRAAWAAALASLGLWWVHVFWAGSVHAVYFTYQSLSLYFSDTAAAVAIAAWLVESALNRRAPVLGARVVAAGGLLLILAAGLSSLGSPNRGVSIAFTLHLLLMAGWFWMTLNDPPPAKIVGAGLAGWMALEAALAAVQVVRQSTSGLYVLALPWPGAITPELLGASVVQTASGLRWLRAYGTLPHPNILAGFLLLGLAATLERYLADGRRGWLAVAAGGMAALMWTFSRANWLAAAFTLAAGAVLVARRARPYWPRYWRWLLVAGAAGLAALLPVLPLVAVRADLGGGAVSTERRSVDERVLNVQDSLLMLAARPLLGVGAGAYVLVLSTMVPPGTPLEPVHSVPLLIAAETGALGAAAALLVCLGIGWRAWQRRRVAPIAEWVWLLLLAAIAAAGLLDHFWWTAPPAQLALATVLGLWVNAGAATPPGGRP